MRIYSEERVETLRARKLLKHWVGDGLLTSEQGERLEEETVSDLRTTNLFLRLVLFFFTIVILAGSFVLFLLVAGNTRAENLAVPLLLLFTACYAAAEYVVREARLYHFGIEEALVVCSIGSLFGGLLSVHDHFSGGSDLTALFILIACAGFSLWTWLRFSYWYTFVASMVFVAYMPRCVTASPAAEHTLLALLYAVGLVVVITVGDGDRFDHMQRVYSVAEAFLWTGIYLSINLVLSATTPRWLDDLISMESAFPRPFYWITWLLIWCLPPVVLVRGVRRRDRLVLALGAGLAILTLISNKPYLGWQRHTWDPMFLGMLLMGGAWFLQRWLARGPGGVREGFTAARLAGKQSVWMNAGPSALGLIVPHSLVHSGPQAGHVAQPLSEGGASGGGGAGGDY